jgi:DNA helicase-2/ATP-dependent DNA helicase PcrA
VSPDAENSPALVAAREADVRMLTCLREGKSLLLEAGAGAGKTYSLIEALKHLIAMEGRRLRRGDQRVACITYTNAATNVINSRIDSNPLVFVGTIHAFCWSLIKSFQPMLRKEVGLLPAWQERLAEIGGVGSLKIEYDLGHRRIADGVLSLHHDDVLVIFVALLPLSKFQTILFAKYPFILIDEYQDTNLEVMNAIKTYILGRNGGSLIGLFGDHWQRIYDKTCGHVEHPNLIEIDKGANFRSATSIVSVLNNMRPELPQAFKDETFVGSALAFHTNSWKGTRRSGAGGHWKGDLPAEVAHQYLTALIEKLKHAGWDFAADKTKILMLTHNVLASEQGYFDLASVFRYNDQFIKKENEYIAFFSDKLEPAWDAYNKRRYGEMFEVLGDAAPSLSSHSDKLRWAKFMDELGRQRANGNIGDVLDFIRRSEHIRLPDDIIRREDAAREWKDQEGVEIPEGVTLVRSLREVPYREVIALDQFIDGHTPFATKHSVKGDEFENVLVILGRGWNQYNFEQFLELSTNSGNVPADKRAAYERNRNLFYVCCSRATTRLALLFTQELSDKALRQLKAWFGAGAVHDFEPN